MAQTFQRLLDTIFSDMDSMVSYLDDLLVAGYTKADTLSALLTTVKWLATNGLTINLDKCVFVVPEIDFLGHRLTAEGATPLDGHVKAVKNFPHPRNLQELQRFLGMLNFFCRFMPGVAHTIAPLTNAMKVKLMGDLVWSAAMADAF